MASYPGTGVPEDPGFTCPGRFERKIWRISVVPIPSRISTPNRLTQRRYTSAGDVSPPGDRCPDEEGADQGPPTSTLDLEGWRSGKRKQRGGLDRSRHLRR